jgi:hypothetical protein
MLCPFEKNLEKDPRYGGLSVVGGMDSRAFAEWQEDKACRNQISSLWDRQG